MFVCTNVRTVSHAVVVIFKKCTNIKSLLKITAQMYVSTAEIQICFVVVIILQLKFIFFLNKFFIENDVQMIENYFVT